MFFFVVCNVVLASTANVCIKLVHFEEDPFVKNIMLFIAFLLNASSFLVLTLLLKNAEMGTSQIAISSSIICVNMTISYIVFGERLSFLKLISFLLCLSAILVLYISTVRKHDIITTYATDDTIDDIQET